jgi:hypothetical protein
MDSNKASGNRNEIIKTLKIDNLYQTGFTPYNLREID